MRIYISGPMTGIIDYKKYFDDAEEKLKELGLHVFNPASTDAVLPSCMTYDEILKIDLDLLEMCDAIFLLKGWQNSKGAKIELQKALDMHISIFLETDGYEILDGVF